MKLYHAKNYQDCINKMKWLSETLHIDFKENPELDINIIENKFFEFLEKNNLKEKYKIYIGSHK